MFYNCILEISSRCSIPKLKHSVLSSLPVLYWLPKYSIWDYGMPDLISGISVGIMHLPQGTSSSRLSKYQQYCRRMSSFHAPN